LGIVYEIRYVELQWKKTVVLQWKHISYAMLIPCSGTQQIIPHVAEENISSYYLQI